MSLEKYNGTNIWLTIEVLSTFCIIIKIRKIVLITTLNFLNGVIIYYLRKKKNVLSKLLYEIL